MPVSLTEEQAHFWDRFCAETGHEGLPSDADMFGTPDMADDLLHLVLIGQKRATCMLYRWVEKKLCPMPQPGMVWLITDARERPSCVIETRRAVVRPVREVTPHFAWREGEGNRMLSGWLRGHRHFFRQEALDGGFAYHDGLLAVFEEFEMIWRG